MSEFYDAKGLPVGDDASAKGNLYTRDLYRAAEMGKRAAELEISTAAIRAESGFIMDGATAGSDKIRHDFRKGILSRYKILPSMDDWTREAIASARTALNAAYYAQDAMISLINRKPEITVEIPSQRESSELVSA